MARFVAHAVQERLEEFFAFKEGAGLTSDGYRALTCPGAEIRGAGWRKVLFYL